MKASAGHLLGLLLLVLASASQAQQSSGSRTIVVGGDHNYPPYEFINDQGQPDGYNTELTRAIAEVMGIEVEIRLGPWEEMRRRLEAGDIDVLQGIGRSDTRMEQYDFSPPHAVITQSVFARKGDDRITDLSELAGKSVIVQAGGVMQDYLAQNVPEARAVSVETHADALRLLASGQHDYALVANLPGLYLERELELSNLYAAGKPFGALEYGYAVPKGERALLAQFSEGLAILENTGRQQAIYDEWLGPLEQPGPDWKRIGLAAGVLSALLMLVLGGSIVWNRMLKREVARRAAELELQQQRLIQADKMTSLGVLVSGVAHEINNPCSLLLLNLPVLKETFDDVDEILEQHYQAHGDFSIGGLAYSRMREEIPLMLDDMLAGTQRIRRIVDDLRDFARQGTASLDESVDLNEVVATAVRLLDNTIRRSTEHFRVDYGDGLPAVRGNTQRIEQVVVNLIVNACQALESPEQEITVITRFLPKTRELRLEVVDQGKGIDPDNLCAIFDPFYTTKRDQGGTGLGLSISANILEDHGGQLVYESELGKGTRVIMSLPVTP
ncbi:transporter substrate-binding domain-containing protein [Marinobacter salinisoli]|uniref:histidine kinase n=1 Tax=Marinobacter salinisoli TaxID=2769486 RepID=A0ABX7MRJ0_9GAMM|nr:transporter substrate-binding domain-containing protein [Marinobacter salinisoli]QSP94977.1 transporter substrate-binding domain-containing protein [Marinobacter salinisoli]